MKHEDLKVATLQLKGMETVDFLVLIFFIYTLAQLRKSVLKCN